MLRGGRGLKYLFTVVFFVLLLAIKPLGSSLVGSAEFESPKTLGQSYQKSVDQLTDYLALKNSPPPSIYAKSFLLLDEQTNEILVSREPHQPIPVASTTKMVTALTAVKLLELDQEVKIDSRSTTVAGSKIGLLPGETITVKSLLKALLIQSGNDAAFALAYAHDSQDFQPFVKEMNELVQLHNLGQTVFADPAGLDDERGRSTTFELSQIARLLLQEPLLAQIVRTNEETIRSSSGNLEHSLKNSNRLVLPDSPYYLPQVLGVKTGFTLEAGHSLVAAYQFKQRRLIGVVMNTTEATIEASAKEMHKLFLWAEDNLEVRSY